MLLRGEVQMGEINKIQSGRLAVLALGLALIGNVALAAESSQDLIVRLRAPQESRGLNPATVRALGVRPSQADVLNAEEGVVKLSFANAEAADRARETL